MNSHVHICKFINQQFVLTLCTNFESDLWCANCYYVFDSEKMALLIMTDAQSRHAELMIKNSNIAGTIAPQPDNVSQIRGIQFSGNIKKLCGHKADTAYQSYCEKFPIANRIPSSIWEISLETLKMTDNTLGFGTKLYWYRKSLKQES